MESIVQETHIQILRNSIILQFRGVGVSMHSTFKLKLYETSRTLMFELISIGKCYIDCMFYPMREWQHGNCKHIAQ